MKVRFKIILNYCLIALLMQCRSVPTFESDVKNQKSTPWTNLNFSDKSGDFNFAIVSDRAGGHRPGIFEDAIAKLDRLSPEFVISIGDLIDTSDFREDSTKFDDKLITTRWLELNNIINQLGIPFFYVPGNNDIRNQTMETYWVKQFGQTYYYFKYKDVLFIVLNSENPPGSQDGSIKEEQLSWLNDTLQKNTKVRWTFIFLHRPMWLYSKSQDWKAVEEALKSRSVTVFAGHHHRYSKTTRDNHDYYGLATTGGASQLMGLSKSQFDHFVWISMSDKGPKISNILLNGVWGDNPTEEEKQINKDK